ncbi:cysteine desulfurase family protein [Spirosoma areae]
MTPPPAVYLDNAATTRLDPEVLDAMLPLMTEQFGNPSSIHSHGRTVRTAIEKARKTVASLLNTSPAEIFFTSGGTEADNTAIRSSIDTYGLTHAITSPLEHHAVLHTLQHLHERGTIRLSLVNIDGKGHVDLAHLDELLRANRNASGGRSLVSLMHGNNEIGNMLNLNRVGEICREYDAIFHSDTVQTMGHFRHDLQQLPVDFIVGAGHKFHGPKGVGFLYINAERVNIHPLVYGGSQERNMRGGTENVYGIVGLAKALDIAYRDMDAHRQHITALKRRMIERLLEKMPDRAGMPDHGEPVAFNGDSANVDTSLYTVLNVSLPASDMSDMLLFSLDIARISASGGSACTSGSTVGSHVLSALPGLDPDRGYVRFSFGKYNTADEIDYAVDTLVKLYQKELVK